MSTISHPSDSFCESERRTRACENGKVIIFDVSSTTTGIARYFFPNLHSFETEKQDRIWMECFKNTCFNQIICEVSKDGNTCCQQIPVLETYVVSQNEFVDRPVCANTKIVKRLKKHSDRNVLLRLFNEELTMLRLLQTEHLRTFALISHNAIFYDTVLVALRAGCNVDMWVPNKRDTPKIYTRLEDCEQYRMACRGRFKIKIIHCGIPKLENSVIC